MEIAEEYAGESKSQERSKLKILIVEDDFPSCKILEEYLSEYGDCTTVGNGAEGVEEFKNALDAGTPYDLVCLDIMMPEMDGHQALRTIRRIEQEHGIFEPRGVSVIMTTAKDRSRDMIEAFNEGCASYIVKPVEQEKLRAEMRKLDLI
jgi:two-component system chemotaxis response regulator CheY